MYGYARIHGRFVITFNCWIILFQSFHPIDVNIMIARDFIGSIWTSFNLQPYRGDHLKFISEFFCNLISFAIPLKNYSHTLHDYDTGMSVLIFTGVTYAKTEPLWCFETTFLWYAAFCAMMSLTFIAGARRPLSSTVSSTGPV